MNANYNARLTRPSFDIDKKTCRTRLFSVGTMVEDPGKKTAIALTSSAMVRLEVQGQAESN